MNKIIYLFLIIFLIVSIYSKNPEKSLKKCLKKCKTKDNKIQGMICVKKCSRKYLEENIVEKSLSDVEPLITNEAMWALYRRSMFYFLKRNDPSKDFTGLQMVIDQQEAAWHLNPSSLSLFSNSVSEWGSIYKITSRTFYSVYQDFLMNLNMAGPACLPQDKANYDSLYNQYQQMSLQIDQAIDKCAGNYESVKNDLGSSYTYEKFQNQWCPNIDTLIGKQKVIFGQMSEYQAKINGEFWETLQTLRNCVKDKNHDWTDNNELQNFFTKAINKQTDSFEINSRKIDILEENRKWIKESSSGFLCFGSGSKEEKTEMKFHGENQEMLISGKGFAAINVAPKGDWFSNSPIMKYKDPKFWLNPNKSFFGENGQMGLMKKIVYVIYKPKVTLKMTQEDRYSFQSQKSSGFSFLFFSSKKNSKVSEVKNTDNTWNVTFENTSDEIQIIGIENTIM